MRPMMFAASLLALTCVAGAAHAQSQTYNNMTLAQFRSTAEQKQKERLYPAQIDGFCQNDIVMINARFMPYPKQGFRAVWMSGAQPTDYDNAHKTHSNAGLDRRHVQGVNCGGRRFVQAVWTN